MITIQEKKHKTLIVFDDIGDMLSNKRLKLIVRKLNNSLVFIIHSYFVIPKDYRLNSILCHENAK